MKAGGVSGCLFRYLPQGKLAALATSGSSCIDARGPMRLVGAKFDTRSHAANALAHLRSALGTDQAGIAPLADGTPTSTLLAGYFDESERDEVLSVLIEHGGEIVTDVDERQLD